MTNNFCSICGKDLNEENSLTCVICGEDVCSEDYDTDAGCCHNCSDYSLYFGC